jgi:hypothetical protein
MKIRDRIKELRRVKASELLPNPKNWRTHPVAQQDALKGILAEVGFAGAVLVRELDDGSLMLIDGHMRAETTHDQEIPVLILDVDEAESDKLLATFDPIAAMAESDAHALDALLRNVDTGSEALSKMLAELADGAGLYSVNDIPAPELKDGDRDPFRQATFTLHDEQFEEVESAMKKAKTEGGGNSSVNENSNGNALAWICGRFNRG